MTDRYDDCCPGTPEGFICKPDNDDNKFKGCERYRFPFGKDEMMMNAEAGLYFKFEEENGVPKNCDGLEHFNRDTWILKEDEKGNVLSVNKKDKIRRAYNMNCPLND